MLVMEVLYAFYFLILILLTSISDIKIGLIYNRTLKYFIMLTIITDFIYYYFFARDLARDFFINFIAIFIISLILFYTKSIAGGDCKLLIVMGMMYPASHYITYNNCKTTLFFAICISIVYGYIFLLCVSLYKIITKKTIIKLSYVTNYIVLFIKSYITVFIYITAIESFGIILQKNGIPLNKLIFAIICFTTSWLVRKINLFHKWYILVSVILFNIFVSLWFKLIILSINPYKYIIIVILLLCQMTIKSNVYENITIEKLKPGMILSSFSSALMQNSRIRGLPTISAEDLRNRLSTDEIKSVKKWAKGRKIENIVIVKKIPFAIFIGLGFISYFIFWSILI